MPHPAANTASLLRSLALVLPLATASAAQVPVPPTGDPSPGTTVAVERFEITGSTRIAPDRVRELLRDALGPAVDAARLQAALQRLRAAYREQGFPLAALRIPRQQVFDGTIAIHVDEGPHRPPPPAPGVHGAPAPTDAADPAAAGPVRPPERTFEVRTYRVLGNTLLPQDVIDRQFTNAVGSAVSLRQIQQAVGGLQLAYRERGHATVGVALPPQQLTNATVTVQVTEGFLADIRIVGNDHFSSNNIRRALPSLRTNELLNSRVFQRELDLANQNRDRQIYPTLGPGPEPGTSAVTLRVKDRRPLHGRVELNNLATPGTPDWRINASVQYNNLWQREHQLGLNYGFTPGGFKDAAPDPDYLLNRPLIANLGAYYRLPLGEPESLQDRITTSPRFGYDEATRQFLLPPAGPRPDLSFFASTASSDTGIQYGPARVVSRTPLLTIVSQDSGRNLTRNDALGARYSLPVSVSDRHRLGLSVGPDFRHFALSSFNTNNFVITTVVTNAQGSQTIESRVASPQPSRENAVDYLPLALALDFSRSDASGSLAANLAVSGNPVGDSADFAALGYSRRAEAGFLRATLAVSREQKLPADWSLLARAAGQVATGPLIGNEQFSVGGSQSVRGYHEGEEFGDAGWFASLELRTPFLLERLPAFTDFVPVWLRGSAFVDAGQRFLVDAAATAAPERPLLGAGLGLSANVDQHLDLRILVGWPLFDTPNIPSGHPRIYFTLGGQF